MTTRRTFLHTSSLATLAALGRLAPRSSVSAAIVLRPTPSDRSGLVLGRFPRSGDPDLHALAMRALDAAKSAGASYADVRFTVTRRRRFEETSAPSDSEVLAVGVRALADGAWGFAAVTEWTPEGMAVLGRKAATQAKAKAWPNVPPIELGDGPPAATGSWQTPIKRDPFTVPPEEVATLVMTAMEQAKQLHAGMSMVFTFERQDRTFVSSEGANVTQTIYTSLGGSPHSGTVPSRITIQAQGSSGTQGQYHVPAVSPTGAGYEAIEALDIPTHLAEWIETTKALANAKPLQTLGESDVVFDAYAMASIVKGTIGAALQYDRAVGYEANAGGTSYLAPPEKMLGAPWASTAITVTADRTLAGGAGTVRWDDDGVTPRPTPLVKEGVVVDYATGREFASELASWYHKHGMPVQSNGCVASESAMTVPLVHTPNLVVRPGVDTNTFDTLLNGIEQGYAILGGSVAMDIQQMTGRGKGAQVYLVRHGKLGALVSKSAYIFKSHDLWRNLVALGGSSTAASRGMPSSKGQPNQVALYTVNAVAAHFQRVRVQPANQA